MITLCCSLKVRKRLGRCQTLAGTALLLVAGILAAPAASAADVSVVQIQQNSYEFTLTDKSVISEQAAHEIIASVAKSVCKDLTPVLREWRFNSTDKLGGGPAPDAENSYRFIQRVDCTSVAKAEVGERRPTLRSAEESRQVQEEIKRKSEAYIRLLTAKQLDQAYAQVDAAAIGMDEATWKRSKASFQAAVGEPIRVSIVKITVYDNPAAAPEPGLYVAADFSNEFKNAPIHCGYLVWFRAPGGGFRITREETGYVTAEQLKTIPSEQVAELKQKLRCVAP